MREQHRGREPASRAYPLRATPPGVCLMQRSSQVRARRLLPSSIVRLGVRRPGRLADPLRRVRLVHRFPLAGADPSNRNRTVLL